MKRQSQSAILSRLVGIALIFACAAIAAAPQARGSGPTVAITEFANDGGAPQSTVSTLGNALYAAIDQSGKFTAVGGGPLSIKNPLGPGGDPLVPALDAARRVHAEEIITTDLISVSGGTITYRLTAYRVDPILFIRSQTFTQSSLAAASLTAGFVTNLSTLHAPRTAVGTIYSVTNGIKADMGAAAGFNLGDQFNVIRSNQKVAEAKIVSIDLNTATIDISNPSAGYKPAIGDQLVGIGVQPAVPPPPRNNVNTFSIIGILFATGAALLALGHPVQPAQPLPSPSPTSSGAAVFNVIPSGQSGVVPTESFMFTFNLPVNTAGVVFTTPTYVSYEKTNSGIVKNPPGTPVTNLGGPSPTFSSGNTVLTINANTLNPGDVVIFSFTSAFTSTTGQSLTPTNVTFTAAFARHPLVLHRVNPAPPPAAVLKPQQGGVLKPPPPPPPPGSGPNKPK
ncbi:MAG TPA: hypothetical protein VGW96_01595 [Candidatus Eremiobacteraceae bacterium]|nr:hypothetical protein [Candidatus Eremiobacteraceae bacterium]